MSTPSAAGDGAQPQVEVEARFLAVDPDALRERVTRAGGTFVSTLFLREALLLCAGEDADTMTGYLRVRDDGRAVLITHKRQDASPEAQAGGPIAREELHVGATDFTLAVTLLERAGLRRLMYREKVRTTYRLGEATVAVDQYPALPPLAEVEAVTREGMETACAALGLSLEHHFPGGVQDAYTHHGIRLDPVAPLRFSDHERSQLAHVVSRDGRL